METSNRPEVARGGDPYRYIGVEALRQYQALAARLLESTPEFLSRAYSRQDLAEALSLRLDRDRRKLFLSRNRQI